MTRPKQKRDFVITNHSKESRRINFVSSTDLTDLLEAFGSIYPDFYVKDSYVLYVTELYDFYEILDYLRTRQLLLNGTKDYQDYSEDEVLDRVTEIVLDHILGPKREPEPEDFGGFEQGQAYAEWDLVHPYDDSGYTYPEDEEVEEVEEPFDHYDTFKEDVLSYLEEDENEHAFRWGSSTHTEPEEEEKPFDFDTFIEAAVSYLEDVARHNKPEPKSFEDEEASNPSEDKEDLVDEMLIALYYIIF